MSHKKISRKEHNKSSMVRESWRDKYSPAPGGVTVCSKCHNVFFKKRWHSAKDIPKDAGKENLKLSVCPACVMSGNGRYEGELVISGMPGNLELEMIRTIAAYGRRATEMNPQHRIIGTRKEKTGYRITTTENQMAARLGKHLRQVFKKADLEITRSEEPFKTERVYLTFR